MPSGRYPMEKYSFFWVLERGYGTVFQILVVYGVIFFCSASFTKSPPGILIRLSLRDDSGVGYELT